MEEPGTAACVRGFPANQREARGLESGGRALRRARTDGPISDCLRPCYPSRGRDEAAVPNGSYQKAFAVVGLPEPVELSTIISQSSVFLCSV